MPGVPRPGAGQRAEPHVRVRPRRVEPDPGVAAARYRTEQARTSFTQANAYLTAMKATEELAWLNEVSASRCSRRSATSRPRSPASSPGAPATRGTSPAPGGSPRSTPGPGSGTATAGCSSPR